MSNMQQTATTSPIETISALLGEIAMSVVGFFAALARAHALALESERLFSMSDAQLAKHGFDRDAIPSHLVSKYFKR